MVGSPKAWGALNDQVVDELRYLRWWLVGGLIAMSAGWYGGTVALDAYHEWQKAGPPPRRRPRRDEVTREAQQGVRQIEMFLAVLDSRHDSEG